VNINSQRRQQMLPASELTAAPFAASMNNADAITPPTKTTGFIGLRAPVQMSMTPCIATS
jgi:hypothetical protein